MDPFTFIEFLEERHDEFMSLFDTIPDLDNKEKLYCLENAQNCFGKAQWLRKQIGLPMTEEEKDEARIEREAQECLRKLPALKEEVENLLIQSMY